MDFEEAVQFLASRTDFDELSDLELSILRESWRGSTYEEIGQKCRYNPDYVRAVACKLWKRISKALACKVTKNNFKASITSKASKTAIQPAVDSVVAELLLPKLQSWDCDEEVVTARFFGRCLELEKISHWLKETNGRMMIISGNGGIGKTSLAWQAIKQSSEGFDFVVWRSLRNAPSLEKLLENLVGFVSGYKEPLLAESLTDCIRRLTDHLKLKKCLIVLDNYDAVLDPEESNPAFQKYSRLISAVCEEAHISKVIITTRQPPISSIFKRIDHIKNFQLGGLDEDAGKNVLQGGNLQGSDEQFKRLNQFYQGNPLLLKIVAASIIEIFAGDIDTFFKQESGLFLGVSSLLNEQYSLLKPIEKDIMILLAIARVPLSFVELHQKIYPARSTVNVMQSLELLLSKALVEKTLRGFTLQPVLMEHVTDLFIKSACSEITDSSSNALSRFPLVEAQKAEHIRSSQRRMLLVPLLQALDVHYGSKEKLVERLNILNDGKRLHNELGQSYWTANLIHLFAHLQENLCDYDFSGCAVWGACLDQVPFHRVDFSGAKFLNCIFQDCFGQIISMACTEDSTKLAVGTVQGEILIYDKHGNMLNRLLGHSHWVGALAFNPAGQLLASGGNDQTVRLWDVETGKCVKVLAQRGSYVHAVSFSADGRFLAFPDVDSCVCVWNVIEDGTAFCLRGHSMFVTSIAFHPQGRWLVSSGFDGGVLVWDLADGESKQLGQFQGAIAWDAKFSNDGQLVAVAGSEGLVRIWDWASGELLHELASGLGFVMALKFVPGSPLLAAAGADGAIRLWNSDTGILQKCLLGHRARVHELIWVAAHGHRQEPMLVSGGIDRELRFWDLSNGNCLRTNQGFSNGVWSLALTSDGRRLVSGHEDGTVSWWDTVSREYLYSFKAHEACIWYIALSGQERWIATASDDCTEAVWDNEERRQVFRWRCPDPYIRTLTFGKDDQFLATNGEGGSLCLWNTQTWGQQVVPTPHHAPISAVACLPPNPKWGDCVWITGSFDGSVQVVHHNDLATPRLLRRQGMPAHVILHHPTTKTLVIGCSDGSIELWRLDTEQPYAVLQAHTGVLETIAVHPHHPIIASGGSDKAIRIWNLNSGKCEGTYLGDSLNVTCLQFLPNGTSLVSGSADGTIRLWHYPDGECYRELRLPPPYDGMNISNAVGLAPSRVTVLKMLGAQGDPAGYP